MAAFAYVLFPFFANPYVLAAVAFLLGLGVGCGQPMSMSLIYALAPPGRAAECAGLRVTANNVTHLLIPLLFGSLGTAFGYAPVFVSNSALLVAGGMLMRKARMPGVERGSRKLAKKTPREGRKGEAKFS